MLPTFIILACVGLAASLSWLSASDSNRSRRQNLGKPCTKYQLPSLLFIGTGHSGSTSLAELMNLHPHLKYGARKEHRYFTCNPPSLPYSECAHDLQEYTASFLVDCETKYTFDATANYYGIAVDRGIEWQRQLVLHHNPGLPAVQEVYNTLPDVKILLIIRDPVDIMFSEGIEDVENMYRQDIPCLANAVETWLKVFPAWRFHSLHAEDAFDDMAKAANEVFAFMGLESRNFTDAELGNLQQSGRRRTERRAPLALRKEYYSQPWIKECKTRLQQLTGLWFSWEGSQ